MPPKKRHSRARRDKRRASSWKATVNVSAACPQCGAPRISHRVCPACGFYNGQLIVPRKVKKKKGTEGAAPAEGGETPKS